MALPPHNNNNNDHKPSDFTRLVSTLVALSLYSYIGETLRIVSEQVFGAACHDATREFPICTTDPGTTSSTGGALFVDLPANMFGCFLIGLFVAGNASLGTPVNMPLACASRSHFLQEWTATHLAIRTGLCGSLTTLASWNTQMVTMLVAKRGTVLPSQYISVMFGYAIGYMTAMEAFRFGKDVAILLHRWTNPDLKREADSLAHSRYIVVHRDLPDLERRFLYDTSHDMKSSHVVNTETNNPHDDDEEAMQYLQEWKTKTHDNRTTLDPFLKELHEIERMVLIENEEPQEYLMDVAADCGWNVQALQNWKQAQGKRILDGAPSTVFTDPSMELWINTCLYVAATAILLWGATNPFFKTTTSRTFQTFSFSVLFAQFGTLLRWTLSRYNGSITAERWKWLPIGTFAANMLACILSSGLAAANLIIPPSFPLAHVFISALKSGFAGSLSTVSTFVVESAALLQSVPQHALGYYYSVGTIVSAALLGIICYAWAAQW